MDLIVNGIVGAGSRDGSNFNCQKNHKEFPKERGRRGDGVVSLDTDSNRVGLKAHRALGLNYDCPSECARGAPVEESGDRVCGRSVGCIRKIGGLPEQILVLVEVESAWEMRLETRTSREERGKGHGRWTKMKHRAEDTSATRERKCR
jgi:hypothetical protein